MNDNRVMSDAERLLELALYELRSGLDVIPTVTEALDALRIEAGELIRTDDEQVNRRCTCQPDLLARGGFRSTCPEHGVVVERAP
jgi:hypothetical protein